MRNVLQSFYCLYVRSGTSVKREVLGCYRSCYKGRLYIFIYNIFVTLKTAMLLFDVIVLTCYFSIGGVAVL